MVRRIANRCLRYAGLTVVRRESSLEQVFRRRREVPIETVIDVGASDGRWSAAVMKFYPGARYLLVEAQAKAHGPALYQFKAQHPNVDYVLCAAGDREGNIYFDDADPFGGAASNEPFERGIVVPMSRIDQLISDKGDLKGPYLLKLDTHGFEVPILEGAKKVLAHASMLVIEAYNFTLRPGALQFYQLCQFLEERGFRCVDVFDILHRPKDGTFWQMDMVFVPSTHSMFSYNSYR